MKISYDRPKISSTKINQKKDFKELMSLQKVMKPFYKQNWFIISSIITCVTILAITITSEDTIKPKEELTITVNKFDSIVEIEESENLNLKEETPCVSRPLKGVTIPFKTFLISTKKANKINYNGATIHIPKKAFSNLNQTTFPDSIELKIRVFNDPVDFIISGIPMEYDSAGMTYTFESGGMIQLEGSTLENQPITINKNTPLKVEFTSSPKNADFNFYHLDTINQKWEYLTSNTLKQSTETFEQNKTHSFDEPSWKLAYKEQNIARQKWEKAEKDVKIHKKNKPIAPKKLKDKNESFTLDIDKYEFPELAGFQSLQFAPIKSSKNISYIYNTEWNNIQLRPHKKAITYELVLKKKDAIEVVVAQPVYEGKDWAKAQHIYGNKFAEYVAILDQKEEKAQILHEEYEEKKSKFDKRDRLKNKAKAVVTAVASTLVAPVISFGIFNFDRPIINRPKTNAPQDNNHEIESIEKPKFTLINGAYIQFEKIYTIESKRNASFTHDLTKSDYFSFNPKSKISIIGIKNKTELYLINSSNFKKGLEANNVFTSQHVKNKSLLELKRLILKI